VTQTECHEGLDDDDEMDIDSGDESDGKSALRQVEARDKPGTSQEKHGIVLVMPAYNIFMSQPPSLTGWGKSTGSSSAGSVLGMFNLSKIDR